MPTQYPSIQCRTPRAGRQHAFSLIVMGLIAIDSVSVEFMSIHIDYHASYAQRSRNIPPPSDDRLLAGHGQEGGDLSTDRGARRDDRGLVGGEHRVCPGVVARALAIASHARTHRCQITSHGGEGGGVMHQVITGQHRAGQRRRTGTQRTGMPGDGDLSTERPCHGSTSPFGYSTHSPAGLSPP